MKIFMIFKKFIYYIAIFDFENRTSRINKNSAIFYIPANIFQNRILQDSYLFYIFISPVENYIALFSYNAHSATRNVRKDRIKIIFPLFNKNSSVLFTNFYICFHSFRIWTYKVHSVVMNIASGYIRPCLRHCNRFSSRRGTAVQNFFSVSRVRYRCNHCRPVTHISYFPHTRQ